MNPNKKRLRRTMMFLNAQKPGLIKDPYIYKPDSIMLDLEDAVAEKEKDAARFSLYHALREINYRGIECIVRINGLDSELWKEDIRCAVAGGRWYPHSENRDCRGCETGRKGGGRGRKRIWNRARESFDYGGFRIGKRCVKRAGYLQCFRTSIWNCSFRRRLHKRSSDKNYRYRGGTYGSKAAHDYSSPGRRCTMF